MERAREHRSVTMLLVQPAFSAIDYVVEDTERRDALRTSFDARLDDVRDELGVAKPRSGPSPAELAESEAKGMQRP